MNYRVAFLIKYYKSNIVYLDGKTIKDRWYDPEIEDADLVDLANPRKHRIVHWDIYSKVLKIESVDNKGKMRLIFKYTSAGVELDKIRMSNKTALTLWSLSRETIVGENGKPSPYIKGDELRQVNFHVRTELSKEEVDKINNSKGIIISSEQRDDFRYGYIPEN